MNRRQWVIAALLIDGLLVNLGIILAFLIRFGGELPAFNFSAYVALVVPITLLQLVIFAAYELYDPERLAERWDMAARVIAGVTLGSVATVALSFFLRQFSFPRLVIVISWVLVIVVVILGRIVAAEWLRIRWPARRVLIVGGDEQSAEIAKELEHRKAWGYRVVGVVSSSKDALSVITEKGVDQVIITVPSGHREFLEDLIVRGLGSVKVDVVPEMYEILIGRPDHTLLADIPLMALTRDPVSTWRRVTKRGFDLVLAIVMLPFYLGMLPFLAITLKLGSRGPVFYRQERVGRAGTPFNLVKLRTMVADAEAESGPVMAGREDSRVTSFGRTLRRLRLDEFPQLWNIIRGQMSFVGPRPERPGFVEEFSAEIPGYTERLSVTPGLTGLAQTSGGYGTSAANKLKYDLMYIRHQSFVMDLKILMHTVRVVLRGREA